MTFDIKLLIGGLILAPAVWGCGRGSDPPASPEDPPPVLVAVAPVKEHAATVEETFVGTVVPLRTAVVASPVEGQVVEFLARKGSLVRAQGRDGAVPLVRLRTKGAAIELAGAAAELEARQHELERLRLSAPREIEQARAREDAAEAAMKFAQSRWGCSWTTGSWCWKTCFAVTSSAKSLSGQRRVERRRCGGRWSPRRSPTWRSSSLSCS